MKKTIKAALCLLLCAALMLGLFSACGKNDGETTYGRYVEYDITPESLSGVDGIPTSFTTLGNGVLEVIMYEYSNGEGFNPSPYSRWRSEDNGATWQELDMSWTEKYIEDYSEYWDNGETPPLQISLGDIIPLENSEIITTVNENRYNAETGMNVGSVRPIRLDAGGNEIDFPLEALEDSELEGKSHQVYNFKLLPGNRLIFTLYIEPPPDAWEDPNFDYNSTNHVIVADANTGKTLYELDINDAYQVVNNETTIYSYDYEKGLLAFNIADGTPSNVELPGAAFEQRIMQRGIWGMFVDNKGVFYSADARGLYKYAPGAEDEQNTVGSDVSQVGSESVPPPQGAPQADTALPRVPTEQPLQGELLMDGLNYSFGSPINTVNNVIHNTETGDIYMVLYESSYTGVENSKVLRYAWDDEAVATSPNKLTVFSLYENYSVRLGLSEFKRQNPDVTIEYETVFTQDDMGGGFFVNSAAISSLGITTSPGTAGQDDLAQTQEDAIRALNTQLLNGQGPDVLILDGLPMDSFIARGVLQDITDIVDANENILMPLADPLRVDGKIYAVPTNFMIPALFANESDMQRLNTLDDLVAAIEDAPGIPQVEEFDPNWTPEEQNAYYQNMSGPQNVSVQPFIAFTSVNSIIEALYPASAPAIFTGQTGVDGQALADFLQAVKTIAEKYELTGQQEQYNSYGGGGMGMSSGYASYSMSDTLYAFSNRRARAGYNLLGSTQILLMTAQNLMWATQPQGPMVEVQNPDTGVITYEDPEPVEGIEFEDIDVAFAPIPGLSSGVYFPTQVVGITTTTTQPEYARAFVSAMLGDDVQNHDLGNGFPVTRSGFERANEDYKEMMSMYTTRATQPEMEEIPLDYENLVNSLSTPYQTNTYLQDIVFKVAYEFCGSNMPLDAAVSQIVSETELYFAERQ